MMKYIAPLAALAVMAAAAAPSFAQSSSGTAFPPTTATEKADTGSFPPTTATEKADPNAYPPTTATEKSGSKGDSSATTVKPDVKK